MEVKSFFSLSSIKQRNHDNPQCRSTRTQLQLPILLPVVLRVLMQQGEAQVGGAQAREKGGDEHRAGIFLLLHDCF
jgi:hypothetical protein